MDISLLKRIICLFIALFFCGTSMNGQEYKYEIGGMVGGSYYMGDLNKNTFFKGNEPFDRCDIPLQPEYALGGKD